MTEEQANDVIENTIKAHWPNWDFRGQELKVWIDELRKFDFDTAKNAINELYKTWEKDRYPKMPHIMAAIRQYVAAKYKTGRQAALFGILTKDGRKRFFDWWGNADCPRQEIEDKAERVRQYCNDNIEPGHIVHFYNIDEKEDTGYYGEEGCSVYVRRQQAKEKAILDILNGPDTKTKRWLREFMNKRNKKTGIKSGKLFKEPITISSVINDDIPF
uniref:Uncharacterized protein n=1 Tax=viral metagenome TaxID=1070528 RepID=A0A6M3JD49_9ZZZZ